MSDFPTDFDSLSWKELAVNLSRYLSSALVSHQTEMSDETMHEALGCCHQVTKRICVERAVPAEDVRAVVDEPVQQRLLPPAFVQPHPPRHEGFLQPEREVPGYTIEQMKEYGAQCVAAFIKQNPQ